MCFLCSIDVCESKRKRSTKEWNELKVDDADNDEDEPPLMTRIAELEAKRKSMGFKDENTGPMILFVTLKHGKRDLERTTMEKIARVWTSKLMSNSLVVEMQLFSKNELLVKILHGWMIEEIQNFILDQSETLYVMRDKKKIPGRSTISKKKDDNDL
jgi:hypothetical protein